MFIRYSRENHPFYTAAVHSGYLVLCNTYGPIHTMMMSRFPRYISAPFPRAWVRTWFDYEMN